MQQPARTEHSPAPSLALALQESSALLTEVDALILQIVSEEIPLIKSVTQHIVASGGKRLRPMLTLLAAKALGYAGDRHVKLAASVEFIHTATLLHDDVVDESKLRRGLETANEVWGNKASVLVGDFLLAQSFQLMVADGSLDNLDILSSAAAIISKGEVMQMMAEGEIATSEQDYIDIISAKTAALFAAACEIAPVIAGQPELRRNFREYGTSLGIAFQMVDDVLDYDANQELLGKTVGDDFREGKITLPVILTHQRANPEERKFLEHAMSGEAEQGAGDLARARELMAKYDVFATIATRAAVYCETARNALSSIPPSPAKAALLEIPGFCMGRVS